MYVLRSCGLLLVAVTVTGCVSLSRYNERVAQVRSVEWDLASQDRNLRQSESARSALDADLKEARTNLAKLQQEHEALKAASVAAPPEAGQPSVDLRKQEFSREVAALTAKLADADARIRNLSAALAAREDAARKVPALEAALAEREQRTRELDANVRSMEATVARMQKDTVALSRKRSGSEEKETAVTALRANLGSEIGKGQLVVKEYHDKLIVSMSEKVLFDSGSARISRSGQKTLDRMAKILKKVKNNQIVVEGHTDNMPIRYRVGKYTSNWELAAARAANVLSHLEKKGQLNPELLALAGYGCYLPAAANDCAKNRRQNRRIEVALVPLDTQRLAEASTKTARR